MRSNYAARKKKHWPENRIEERRDTKNTKKRRCFPAFKLQNYDKRFFRCFCCSILGFLCNVNIFDLPQNLIGANDCCRYDAINKIYDHFSFFVFVFVSSFLLLLIVIWRKLICISGCTNEKIIQHPVKALITYRIANETRAEEKMKKLRDNMKKNKQ